MQGVRRIDRHRKDQRGLVIVYFAMTLVVLMIASAFVVDVGAWYVRGNKIQRAADAAAMAGVTYMPGSPAQAISTAITTATANGFTDGANGGTIHVTAAVVSGHDRQLQVTIKDDKVAQYFSTAFYSGTSESRHALAEYVAAIPMGSPENGFGMGDLYASNTTSLWAAVDGYCSPREQGDLLLAHTDGQYVSSAWTCPASGTSDAFASSYDPGGYTYDVEVAAGRSNPLVIEAWDPGYVPYAYSGFSQICTGGPDPAINPPLSAANNYSVETDYTVTWPDGTTSYSPFPSTESGPGFGTHSASASSCQQWVTLATIPTSAPAGTYTVNVKTKANEANSFGSNAFALEAVYSVSGAIQHLQRCSTISGVTYVNTYPATPCPQVHGQNAISVFANADNKGVTQFYLAQIGAAYAGNTMTIKLWDPGEGGQQIRILNNQGAAVQFDYTVSTPCSTGCSGTVLASSSGLSISGSGTQSPNRVGTSKFNDRMVTLTVTIPAGYASTAATANGWWKIDYNPGVGNASISDRTTWQVSVSGNPVHLLNG